ncbi:membrane dipeptidase [Olivibacter sp. SDN3]|uniref:dipeptidase n=1 Tax=Olivibacter sp. SDN3 TaxID=2764720 RepID=UPI0016511A4E|nr:dipeptidase [Olivibacter sp. SDN3]QNL50825.1 membrane dipeptidase [Olivibacter sp. SDN3]
MKLKSLIICLVIWLNLPAQQKENPDYQEVLVDLHNDVLSETIMRGKDIAKRLTTGHTDIPRLKEGGVNVQFFSVWCDGEKAQPFRYANRQIDALYNVVKENGDYIMLAHNAQDIENGLRQHKIVAMIGVEGGHMIENRIDYIDSLYQRGVRYLTLTWNNSTDWASSAIDESNKKAKQKGLNDFGRKVIRHMNTLGMIVDLSHVGEQTFYDALEITTKPVFVSHSDVYAINPHYRNVKDGQIRAIAKNGGVIGVNFYADFLDPSYRRKLSVLYSKYVSETDSVNRPIDEKYRLLPAEAKQHLRPPLSLLVDHIDYLVKLVGIDHVAIGADFDGMSITPLELDDVSSYPNLVRALRQCGYSRQDVRKVLGENVLRVIKAQEQ